MAGTAPATGVRVRILKLSDVYFPRVNGVSTSIQTFRTGLEALGHETWLIAPAYGAAPVSDDPRLLRVPSRPVPRDPEDRLMAWQGLLSTARLLLAEQRFDAIHVHTPFLAHYAGVRLKRETGLPLVETYHTYFEEYLHHYAPFVPRSWLRALARRVTVSQCAAVDALVVPSQPMLRVLDGYGVAAASEVLPTGLDLARFRGGDGSRFRAQHGIDPATPLLVHISRVAHEKNIGFIVRMFARVRAALPAARLVIAGEGPAERDLRTLVASLGLAQHVDFVGYLDRERALKDCYCAADAFVFASRTETQGLVLLEAMALGVPVVSTAVLGTAAVLDGARGALVVPDEEAGFAAGVLRVLTDPTLAADLRRGGPQTAAAWSGQAMAERLAAVYGRLSVPAGGCDAR